MSYEAERYLEILETDEYANYRRLLNEMFEIFMKGLDYKLPSMVEFFLTHQALNMMALESLLKKLLEVEARIDNA